MLTTTLNKKFKPLSPHILTTYIWKKFTISQALSGSLVICPSSGGYLPFDEHTRLFYWVMPISKPKRKSSNCKKTAQTGWFFTLGFAVWEFKLKLKFFQLLLFIPPSPKTPYFSIQKLSLASITKGSELLIFSKGRKLKWANSCPGRLKWSPTPVSQWFLTAPLCSVHLCLQGLVSPTLPTYWAGFLRRWPAPCEQVTL